MSRAFRPRKMACPGAAFSVVRCETEPYRRKSGDGRLQRDAPSPLIGLGNQRRFISADAPRETVSFFHVSNSSPGSAAGTSLQRRASASDSARRSTCRGRPTSPWSRRPSAASKGQRGIYPVRHGLDINPQNRRYPNCLGDARGLARWNTIVIYDGRLSMGRRAVRHSCERSLDSSNASWLSRAWD